MCVATFSLMRKEDDSPWGDYLEGAMKAARLSPAELSRASGVNQTQISLWVRGESQPSLSLLRKLVQPLGVPLLELAVAAGHFSREEARLRDAPRPPEPVNARQAIERDMALSDELRSIVLAAYDAAVSSEFGPATAAARERLRKERTATPESGRMPRKAAR